MVGSLCGGSGVGVNIGSFGPRAGGRKGVIVGVIIGLNWIALSTGEGKVVAGKLHAKLLNKSPKHDKYIRGDIVFAKVVIYTGIYEVLQ